MNNFFEIFSQFHNHQSKKILHYIEHFDISLWGTFNGGLWDWSKNKRPYGHFPSPFSVKSHSSLTLPIRLNLDAWYFGLHRKLQIELSLLNKDVKPHKKDYEACVSSGCYEENPDLVSLKSSGNMEEKDCCNDFKNLCIKAFGVKPPKISKKTDCNYPVGNCAEQHVINGLISQSREDTGIKVSIGLRPRTMTFIDNCNNCKAIISLL